MKLVSSCVCGRRIVIPLLFLFGTCYSQVLEQFDYVKLSGKAQGTTYHITYENSVKRNLQKDIDSILKAFDLSLSVYIPNSIISRINSNDKTVRVDKLFKDVFQKSKMISENTGGAFDITVGPLVNAWGFGPKGRRTPTKSQVDSLLKFVGMDKVSLVGDKLIKKYPQVSIDVNAIAQGFSVDVVCGFLQSKGVQNYVVEIGGELKAKGKNSKGDLWKVGVDKPIDGNNAPGEQIQQVLCLNNQAVATSGDYRKYYEEKGVKYAHHIDPHSGFPAHKTILSVSVISNECAISDGYATAFMVSGLDKTKEYLKKHKELDAYIIYSDKNGKYCEFLTDGAKKMIAK